MLLGELTVCLSCSQKPQLMSAGGPGTNVPDTAECAQARADRVAA